MWTDLDLNHQAIGGTFEPNFLHPFQDLTANMTQEQAPAAQAGMVFYQLGIADVKRRLSMKIATLADKKLGVVGVADQVFIPAT